MSLEIVNQYLVEYNIKVKTIIEFGFFDGADSKLYARNFSDAQVYSLEANPYNYKRYSKEMEDAGVKAFHYAVSNKIGTVPFNLHTFKTDQYYEKGSYSPGCTILGLKDKAIEDWGYIYDFNKEVIDVPTITIEQFCIDNNITSVDLMHIDVEGALREVLEGFGSIRPKLIQAETDQSIYYTDSNTREEYDDIFLSMDYIIKRHKAPDTYYIYKDSINE